MSAKNPRTGCPRGNLNSEVRGRGRPPADLYKILEAIVFVASEGCSWRAIDRPELRWNTVYQYYRKWCREGIWERMLFILRGPLTENCAVDSTQIKVHQSASNAVG